MHKKLRIIIFLLLLVFICGCEPDKPIPTPTPSMTTTPTEIPRWVIYENALSKAILRSEGGLCEWMIYGMSESKKEVYVWASCQFQAVWGQAGAGPAVIYLEDNGDIAKVVIPRDGDLYADDIHIMFPPDIQERIFAHEFDVSEAKKNMNLRRTEEALPLIVASGTPLP